MNHVEARFSAPLSRSQFLAELASRLGALPDPLPDLAVFIISLPDLEQFGRAHGAVACEMATGNIVDELRYYAGGSLISLLPDGRMAFTYEHHGAWTCLKEVSADLQAIIDRAARVSRLGQATRAELGVAVQTGHAIVGSSLDLAHEMLRRATLALQVCRSNGTKFEVYEEAYDQELRSAALLNEALRHAVDADELVLHYQPLVDLQTLEIVALEALVRWDRPSYGLRGPGDFIPQAEESGLIVELGAKLLMKAMRQADEWLNHGLSVPRIAVNVSASQLVDAGFLGVVKAALDVGSAGPQHLEIEITERMMVCQSTALLESLAELRRWGVTIALDDFGTGYSSLQYLRHMPIDKIKVDRAFVREIGREPRDQAVLRAVVGMGRAFGMAVVAEGIEDWDQADAVRNCGCSIGQGYLFARPVEASVIADLPRLMRAAAADRPLPSRSHTSLASTFV